MQYKEVHYKYLIMHELYVQSEKKTSALHIYSHLGFPYCIISFQDTGHNVTGIRDRCIHYNTAQFHKPLSPNIRDANYPINVMNEVNQ